ncbi:MAG: hypothetical protein IJG60_00345 [Thermoguttaceae bacterium]|nr:hypothetical protein [Thermoguttaceae bacterium]
MPAEKEDGLHIETCYESWVLLPDERSVPIRLLSRTLPPGVVPAEDDSAPLGRDRITADGIFYRLASYNAGDDFYSSPVIVCDTFTVVSAAPKPGEAPAVRSPWFLKGIALAALFFLWLSVRFILFRSRRNRTLKPAMRHETADPDFRFDESDLETLKEAAARRTAEPENADPDTDPASDSNSAPEEPNSESSDSAPPASGAGKILPLLLAAFISAGALAAADEADPADPDPFQPQLDRRFWEEVTPLDADALFESESEESLAFEESLQILTARLQNGISPGLLAASAVSDPAAALAFPDRFGEPVRFTGTVTRISRKRLDVRADFAPIDLYRVELDAESTPLVIYTPAIPKGWGPDGEQGTGAKTAGLGIFFEKFESPVIIAPRLAWYGAPDALGRLGFDVSLFDRVEAHAISELAQLPPGADRKRMLRNFRLTPDDRYPFYGLLAEAAKAPPVPADALTPLSAADLFNRPADSQGKPVRLTGHVRRAQPVLVPDSEIQALGGPDHYYELYLFTADSQDYPILFCIPELPRSADGTLMTLGSGPDYRQEVTLTGFLYKPWAYRIDTANSTLAPGFLDSDKEGKSWIAVPLMIGLSGTWTPGESGSDGGPFSQGVYYLLSGFLFMVILYMLLRHRLRSKPVRFTVGGKPDLP